MRLIQEEFIIKMNELGYDLQGSDPIRETLFGTIYEMAVKLSKTPQPKKTYTKTTKKQTMKDFYSIKEDKDEEKASTK